ncbi:hypothetical protein GF362_04540 [Candidatus Dojkabacteria bacterium]|nr:hypothetical protein [Candidatus Dojkabacteria bacterium]
MEEVRPEKPQLWFGAGSMIPPECQQSTFDSIRRRWQDLAKVVSKGGVVLPFTGTGSRYWNPHVDLGSMLHLNPARTFSEAALMEKGALPCDRDLPLRQARALLREGGIRADERVELYERTQADLFSGRTPEWVEDPFGYEHKLVAAICRPELASGLGDPGLQRIVEAGGDSVHNRVAMYIRERDRDLYDTSLLALTDPSTPHLDSGIGFGQIRNL